MNDLLDDLVIRILGFLSSSDIHRTLAVNKRFHGFFEHIYLWKYLCHRGAATKSLIRSLLAHNTTGNTLEASIKSDGSSSSFYPAWKECEQYKMISRQLEGMSKLEKLKWNSAEIRSHNATNRLERMEAHSMTLILDRFAVIINGWGQSELNDVTITDCCTLPVLRTIRVDTIRPPRFRYGFSTTYYRGRLFVYGGCCNGGYSGDINDLYVVELTFLGRDEQVFFSCSRDEEMIPSDSCWDRDHSSILSIPPDGFKGVEALYSSNKTLVDARKAKTTAKDFLVPTSRGYHTAVVVQLDGRDQLLVWGGLHARRPTGRLELLDLTQAIKGDDEQSPWTAGQYSGMEPSPRFGHSCILLRSDDTCSDVYESCSGKPCPGPAVTVDRLVFIGGSDGNDLIRNGRELREIHVLHIVRRSPSQSLKGQSDELVWSRPTCTTLLHADVFPGRCHCSALVGNRIILFGGGAHHSNATSILDVCTKKSDAFLASTGDDTSCQGADLAGIFSSDEHTLRMVDDSHSGPNKPLKRCSAASVLVGKYFMIMGGFNSQRSQLGDVWLLDVSYETSDGFRADAVSAALRAQQTSSTSLSLVGVEGYQPDQEEAAQSGGTSSDYSFQNIIQMAQLGIIDWSATTTFYDLINMLNNQNDADSGDDDEEEEDNMDDDDDDDDDEGDYDEDGDDDEDYHDFDEQDDDTEEDDGMEVEGNATGGGEL